MPGDDRTTVIQNWLDRLKAGDETARAGLIECACGRLARLARKMHRDFEKTVGRWEDFEDVLQNSLLRLDRALREVTPSKPIDFFRLAAVQIRRELIDLSRKYNGPEGLNTNLASWSGDGDAANGVQDFVNDKPETTLEPGNLSMWTEFHRAVENLPEAERRLFDLIWYHELTATEAAEMLGENKRTVQRRWTAAKLRLVDAVGGALPGRRPA